MISRAGKRRPVRFMLRVFTSPDAHNHGSAHGSPSPDVRTPNNGHGSCTRVCASIRNDDHSVHNLWDDDIPYDNNPYGLERKSTRLNSSHQLISYAVFC